MFMSWCCRVVFGADARGVTIGLCRVHPGSPIDPVISKLPRRLTRAIPTCRRCPRGATMAAPCALEDPSTFMCANLMHEQKMEMYQFVARISFIKSTYGWAYQCKARNANRPLILHAVVSVPQRYAGKMPVRYEKTDKLTPSYASHDYPGVSKPKDQCALGGRNVQRNQNKWLCGGGRPGRM